MHRKQIVAENVQITNEWTEIISEKPLKPTKIVQKVMLVIEGYENDIENNDFENITLKDGTKIFPEVQIVDENNKIYQLRDRTRIGSDIGFSPDEKVYGTSSFPKDLSCKTLRIRSDKPFLCKKIYWYDYDLK